MPPKPSHLRKLKFGISAILTLSIFTCQAQCNTDHSVTHITTNTTWNTVHNISGDLVIDSAITLIIKDTVTFKQNATLTIARGGRLKLFGGTLTHSCSTTPWMGVIILGNSTRRQWPSGVFDIGQGVLVADSGATIQWAEKGAQSQNGGIIQATKTTFMNCTVSAEILPYSDPAGTKLNYCFFTECNFLATDTIPTHSATGVTTFVNVQGVTGINFAGDSFVNSIPQANLDSFYILNGSTWENIWIVRGTGIVAVDAAITVDRAGPDNYLSNGCIYRTGRKSYFIGLNTGISHQTTSSLYPMKITNSEFRNNQVNRILCLGDDNTFIWKNLFYYDTLYINEFSDQYLNGIGLYGSKNFDIDSNTFFINNNISGPITQAYLILVRNAGAQKGYIYSNNFYANYVTNHHGVLPINLWANNTNIVMNCNTFSNFYIDVHLDNQNYKFYNFNDQGSDTADAGNLFSTCTGAISKILTVGTYKISYFTNTYNTAKTRPTCNARLNIINVGIDNPCPPTTCNTTYPGH